MTQSEAIAFEMPAALDPAFAKLLGEGLTQHAIDAGLPGEWRDICVVARDPYGRIVGGHAGNTGQGMLNTRLLWVHPDYRRSGLGRRLMALAEAEAIRRGCHTAFLDTFSFQGPDYYPKLGYAEFGRIEGVGPQRDLSRHWFMKRLT